MRQSLWRITPKAQAFLSRLVCRLSNPLAYMARLSPASRLRRSNVRAVIELALQKRLNTRGCQLESPFAWPSRIHVQIYIYTRTLRSASVWSGQKIEWPKNTLGITSESVVPLSNVQNCTRTVLSSAHLPGCVRLCVGGCSVFLSAGLGLCAVQLNQRYVMAWKVRSS